MPEKQTRYDAIPYLSNPFRQTHPEHLASIAALFGLDAPERGECRVLELGCSSVWHDDSYSAFSLKR